MAHGLSSSSSLSHPDDPIPLYPAEDGGKESLKISLLRRAERSHRRLPGIRKIPLPAIGIILLIAAVNVVVWVVAGVVLVGLFCCFIFSLYIMWMYMWIVWFIFCIFPECLTVSISVASFWLALRDFLISNFVL